MERRKYKRYQVKNGAYTVNSTKPGLIIDIGMGGLAFRYIDRKDWPEESFELDIVFDDKGFRLAAIPYTVVSDSITDNDFSSENMVVKRRSVQFGNLSSDQVSKLQKFIDHNTTAEIVL
ncbi:MAG: PilZ domain-containing protein [Proteobacteria bacterium]|nr:PilZ domain-containing protein [Pseudomonadota bacterium]MBU1714081.1 PilZ domain-containing protein [Pseudomonadota bacterium]